MSCQCHQIGGPFIAEDPDCAIHGWQRRDRELRAGDLLEASQREDISVDELRQIVQEFYRLVEDIY